MSPDRNTSEQSLLQRLGPRGVLAIVLGIVVVIFIFENTHKTDIRFIGPKVSAPLWLALVITAVLGGAAGYLIARHRANR